MGREEHSWGRDFIHGVRNLGDSGQNSREMRLEMAAGQIPEDGSHHIKSNDKPHLLNAWHRAKQYTYILIYPDNHSISG